MLKFNIDEKKPKYTLHVINNHMEYQENWTTGIQDTRVVWEHVLVNFVQVKG